MNLWVAASFDPLSVDYVTVKQNGIQILCWILGLKNERWIAELMKEVN